MKKLATTLIVLLLLAGGVEAKRLPKHRAQQTAERVATLINTNDYRSLERLTPEEYDLLPPLLQLLTDATVGSRFNDLDRSNRAIETLLNDHAAELDGPTQSWLFGMLLGNLRVGGEYGAAAEIAAQLRGAIAEDDELSRKTLDDMIRWFGALSRYPKTRITLPEGGAILPLYIQTEQIRNVLGERVEIRHLTTDVQIGGTTERFLFDTGCSHASFVSEEFAAKHGIRILCDSILVSGAAAQGYAKVGILDSMCVGPITIFNPTFTITPANPAIDTLYKIPPVLGTDFMNLAGELQLFPQEGRLVIPARETPIPESGRNLALETQSGQYTLQATCDGEPVEMVFDTGSVYTSMNTKWFDRHKERVSAEGRGKEIGVGGFGGTAKGYGYVMPSLRFGLGTASCDMPCITVYSDIKLPENGGSEGYIGVDFVLNFNKVTINFDKGFVTAQQAVPTDR